MECAARKGSRAASLAHSVTVTEALSPEDRTMQSAHCSRALELALLPRLRAGLALLLEAQNCASELNLDPWDFSLELRTLQNAGLGDSQLRWLLAQGYLQQAVDMTPAFADRRTFRAIANLTLHPCSCFILTRTGLALARQLDARPLQIAPNTIDSPLTDGSLRPRWLGDCQELLLGDRLIKKFRRPAPNQIAILTAFENTGWPHHVGNPLSTDLDGDAVERLHDAIKRLNCRQHTPVLRFHGDGTGAGVTWELVPTIAPH